MPELPEVETTARYLREKLIGETVSSIEVLWARTLSAISQKSLISWLPGASVKEISRRGKFIIVELGKESEQAYLLAHMRMSGSFDVVQASLSRGKHDRFIVRFKNDRELRFDDPRKFGRLYLVPHHTVVTHALGKEPLDTGFTDREFYEMLHKKKGAIKPLLLNQTFIAGIGNIYADESLWYSGIHPLAKANRLTGAHSQRLFGAIRRVLKQAIKTQGTDNGDGVVNGGMYSPKVYGRDGKPCKRCRTTIKRIVVGQRGTHFCPQCQKRR